MLTDEQRRVLDARLGPLLEGVRATGRAEIAAQNRAAIQATGKLRFDTGQLATMASWPRRIYPRRPTDFRDEYLAGPNGELYGFSRGDPVTYTEHRAGWGALRQELDIIREVMDLGSDEEAHRLLPEIHKDFSYGVLILALRAIRSKGGLCTPLAIRSQAVGSNQGTISLLGGFVRPGETVFAAAERQLAAEGSLKACFRRWGAWGPHNAAQSGTFVIPADVDDADVGIIPSMDAWEFEGRTFFWVNVNELARMLAEPKPSASFRRRFGLPRGEISFAPDMIRPTLAVIQHLGIRRRPDGLVPRT